MGLLIILGFYLAGFGLTGLALGFRFRKKDWDYEDAEYIIIFWPLAWVIFGAERLIKGVYNAATYTYQQGKKF